MRQSYGEALASLASAAGATVKERLPSSSLEPRSMSARVLFAALLTKQAKANVVGEAAIVLGSEQGAGPLAACQCYSNRRSRLSLRTKLASSPAHGAVAVSAKCQASITQGVAGRRDIWRKGPGLPPNKVLQEAHLT